MIFSTSIDLLKSLLTVSRKFIFFHPNDTVHFRSFQSFHEERTLVTVSSSFRFPFDHR